MQQHCEDWLTLRVSFVAALAHAACEAGDERSIAADACDVDGVAAAGVFRVTFLSACWEPICELGRRDGAEGSKDGECCEMH